MSIFEEAALLLFMFVLIIKCFIIYNSMIMTSTCEQVCESRTKKAMLLENVWNIGVYV